MYKCIKVFCWTLHQSLTVGQAGEKELVSCEKQLSKTKCERTTITRVNEKGFIHDHSNLLSSRWTQWIIFVFWRTQTKVSGSRWGWWLHSVSVWAIGTWENRNRKGFPATDKLVNKVIVGVVWTTVEDQLEVANISSSLKWLCANLHCLFKPRDYECPVGPKITLPPTKCSSPVFCLSRASVT